MGWAEVSEEKSHGKLRLCRIGTQRVAETSEQRQKPEAWTSLRGAVKWAQIKF